MPKPPQFPDRRPEYQAMLVAQAQAAAAAEAAREAQAAAEAAAEAARVAEAQAQAQALYQAAMASGGVLTGSLGYDVAGPNCVDLARAYGKDQPGNPISWGITTRQPFIGAAVLFYFNHVGIISGIWSNGDVEVMQENSPGAPHRYSPSQVRGYF